MNCVVFKQHLMERDCRIEAVIAAAYRGIGKSWVYGDRSPQTLGFFPVVVTTTSTQFHKGRSS